MDSRNYTNNPDRHSPIVFNIKDGVVKCYRSFRIAQIVDGYGSSDFHCSYRSNKSKYGEWDMLPNRPCYWPLIGTWTQEYFEDQLQKIRVNDYCKTHFHKTWSEMKESCV